MKIGGFMYSEQAYLYCQEAIRQEAGTQPPHTRFTPVAHLEN